MRRITSPNQGNHYRAGGYYAICDECGLKYRASEMRMRWDKAFVCREDWEPQHPQEFLRGQVDKIKPDGPLRNDNQDAEAVTFGGILAELGGVPASW